jgi:hypothetical protein
MDTLPLSIANGWASGISAYGTVLIAGLLGRFGAADTPSALQRTDLLVFVGILDAGVRRRQDPVRRQHLGQHPHRHTADDRGDPRGAHRRPRRLAGPAIAASTSSITALLSHLTKGGLRLAVNTSPEPVTNIGTSLAEDGAVVGVTLLAWQYPWIAAAIASTLLVLGMLLVYFLLSRVRRGLARLRDHRSRFT